jgi:hypothetical protein
MPSVLERARTAEDEFARSRLVKAAAAERFAEVDDELTAWLAKARLVVMLAHGSKWSQSWVAAGFTHRGTNVPKRIKPRMELSRRLVKFFEDYPQYEVPFAGVTAAEAGALQEKITAADQKVRLATSEAAEKKQARHLAEKLLRRELRLLRVCLYGSLKKNDRRWKEFGFKIPKPDKKPLVRYFANPAAEPVRIDFAPAVKAPRKDAAVA